MRESKLELDKARLIGIYHFSKLLSQFYDNDLKTVWKTAVL